MQDCPPAGAATWCMPTGMQGRPPIAQVNVLYVDDFLLMAQTRSQCTRVLRHTLMAIAEVFCPLEPQDPPPKRTRVCQEDDES